MHPEQGVGARDGEFHGDADGEAGERGDALDGKSECPNMNLVEDAKLIRDV